MLGEGGPAGLELTMEPRWTDPNLLQTSQVVRHAHTPSLCCRGANQELKQVRQARLTAYIFSPGGLKEIP